MSTRPTVYLAMDPQAAGGKRLEASGLLGPTVYLAHVPGAQGDNTLLGQRGVEQLPTGSRPALLISFFYLDGFLTRRPQWAIREWCLDSGAFSADNVGATINLDDYIKTAKRLLKSDPMLTEVFSLDVIGDPRATLANTEKMWKAGVHAIPTYHYGSRDWGVLKELAARYPKIALGGAVGLRAKVKKKFVEQVFARVWPKRVHGFGCGGERMVLDFPFDSVDATNWEVGPCKFGSWRSFGRQRLSWRGANQNLRAEVEWYLALERRARARWASVLKEVA